MIFSVRSVLPEVAESRRGQLGVANRVLDILVAEILLDCSRIVPIVGEFVSRCMSKHVRVNRELELGHFPSSGDEFANR